MAHSMAEMAPAPWKSKPSRAPALSMAVPSNTYATNSLMPSPGKKGPIQLPRRPPTRNMISAIPLAAPRSEEHTSELQSHSDLVCRLLLEKKKKKEKKKIGKKK